MRCTLVWLMPTSSPIMRTLQCVAWAGRSLTVFSTIARFKSLGNRLLAGRLASSFDHAGDASFDKILLPAPNGRLGDADRSHNCHYARAVGRHQHNLGPFCDLLGSFPIPDYLLKLGAILGADCEFRVLRFHAARESYSQRFGIHMFVTEQ